MPSQCQIGSEVMIRVGGDFLYSPTKDAPPHGLLLLAAGVGINPIYSILQHAVHLRGEGQNIRVYVLYSAKTKEELIFKVSYFAVLVHAMVRGG